jgi:Bacterial SH3 domain
MRRPLLVVAALVAMTTASHATGCAVVAREGLVDGYLNLRTGPGTVYPAKTRLLPGAVVFVSNNYVGNWWNVESFSQHSNGWVNSRWLKPIDCGFASASPANPVVLAPPAPPPPIEAPSMLIHNGSLMSMSWTNGGVVIRYVQPRPSLAGLVAPGTTLIEGNWQRNNFFVGRALVFSRCGAVPYPVQGNVDSDQVLTLFGAAPVIDPYSCLIVDYDTNGRNGILRFDPA